MSMVHKKPDDRPFRKHLLPDERIEWVGRPKLPPELVRPLALNSGWLPIVVVLIGLSGAAMVFNFTRRLDAACIACAVVVAYEALPWLRRPMKSIVYAVTDKRVLLLGSPFYSRSSPEAIGLVDVTPVLGGADDEGFGSIILNRPDLAPEGTVPEYRRMLGGGFPIILVNVPDARGVRDLILRLQREASR